MGRGRICRLLFKLSCKRWRWLWLGYAQKQSWKGQHTDLFGKRRWQVWLTYEKGHGKRDHSVFWPVSLEGWSNHKQRWKRLRRLRWKDWKPGVWFGIYAFRGTNSTCMWIYQGELRCWAFTVKNPGKDKIETMVVLYRHRNNLTLSKPSSHSVHVSNTFYRASSGCLQCSCGC